MLAEPKQVVPSWWQTGGPITLANDIYVVAVVSVMSGGLLEFGISR